MIVIITVVGLTNFFAPFFSSYKTDPLITYIFMGTASAIAGYKGAASLLYGRLHKDAKTERED